MGTVEPGNTTFTPEGVEGYIPYAGVYKYYLILITIKNYKSH